eukprot:Nitzschia sp. Nitz4//scaffold9_size221794//13816//16691//NITZ4_001314-RA/size221794-processed-gene-0.39-mRNA-1//-1//CDS//3329560905//5344//frame0
MTSSSVNPTEPSRQAEVVDFQKLRDLVERSDDSEVEVVSSAKQKFEKMQALLMQDDDVLAVPTKAKIVPRIPSADMRAGYSYKCWASSMGTFALAMLVAAVIARKFRSNSKATSPGAQVVAADLSILTGGETPPPSRATENNSVEISSETMIETYVKQQRSTESPKVPSLQGEPDGHGNEQSALSVQVVHTETTHTSVSIQDCEGPLSPGTPTMTQEEKAQVATRLAQDIRILQEALQEQGLDVAMAAQMAVGLQSSQHLIASQHRMEKRRLILDAHQKQLDRHQSRRQHDEAMAAARYDPQWKEKLEQRRDCCWNAVSRLMWDVSAAQLMVALCRPVVQFHFAGENTNILSTLTLLIIDSFCECHGATSLLVTGASTPSSSENLVLFLTWTGIDASLLLQTTCYSYCVLSFVSLAVGTWFFHNILRMFAAPTLVHHVVNAVTLAFLFGPARQGSPTEWLNQVWQENPSIPVMGACMVSLFAIVQRRYELLRVQISQAQTTMFNTTFENGMKELGDLQFQISLFGEVEDIHLVRQEDTGKSKGFAFVKYEDCRSCVLAVDNFVGAKLMGRSLRVDHVENYRLPKNVAERANQEGSLDHGAGHAYGDAELSNSYTISSGHDLFSGDPVGEEDKELDDSESSKRRHRSRESHKKEDRKRKKHKKDSRSDRDREKHRHRRKHHRSSGSGGKRRTDSE